MTTPRYYFDTRETSDFGGLCQQFTGKSLRSPYRSTVPLLSLLEHSQPQWNALLEALGAPVGNSVHLEYRVASPKPGGNPSQTDALISSDEAVWAIEAKWTEPRYETIASRLRQRETDGGDPAVTVDGWLDYLRPFSARALAMSDFSDVVYQVVHRAASACAIAMAKQIKPHLVYLHFHPSPLASSATTAQYVADLGALHALLGSPSSLSFTVAEMRLEPTAAFDSIKHLDKHSSDTSRAVVEALSAGPLFTFGPPEIRRI